MPSKSNLLLLPGILMTLCLPVIANAQYAYDIVSLGNEAPAAINNRGQVVGYHYPNNSQQPRVFEYSNGQTSDLFPASATGLAAVVAGFNDQGQIAGNSASGPYVYDTTTRATQSLGVPFNSYAHAINQNGDVAGQYRYHDFTGPTHAFIYFTSTGQLHDIHQIGGLYNDSEADAINNVGQAAGNVVVGNQVDAFIYSNGVMQTSARCPARRMRR